MNNSIRLRNLAPDNVVFVSESGIKTQVISLSWKETG